ncbi:slit homolog 1 protein-like isoform X2 [Ornithodoros turicata]|uniref:slit homolog 1 protein-like isoform X2 n=1 Tax=Ornithodoros turicata TaxID=34597 RepID=UPI00313872DC
MQLYVAFVYVSAACLSLCQTQCPDVLDPTETCKCSLQNRTPTSLSKDQVWITCLNLTELPHLTHVLTAMKNREVHKFQLGTSHVGYLPNTLFRGIRVHEVQVWDTPLTSFVQGDADAFLGLEGKLRWLTLRRCKLHSDMPFQRMANLTSLESLDLSFNRLTTVKESWFRYFPSSLASLSLKGNAINKMDPKAFAGLLRLFLLDLSENNIKTMQRSMLPDQLFILNLNDNRLSSLPEGIFGGMTNLRRVYLNGNRFTTLDYGVWAAVWSNPKLGIEVRGNPINCDCNVQWMVKLHHFATRCSFLDCQQYILVDGMCNSPPSVAGHPLVNLTCDKLPCDEPCEESNEIPILANYR